MIDRSPLDNPAWYAMLSLQQDIAILDEGVARYQDQVSAFAAVEIPGRLDNLERLVQAGQVIVLASRRQEVARSNDGWQELSRFDVFQMVCENPAIEGDSIFGRRLGEADEHAMLSLADLTEPGPFALKTGRMGAYFGVDGETGLLSMAGERFRLPAWVEVSGVCTHPDARGKGYAFKLVADVMRGIATQGAGAFLHVRKGSPSEFKAIELYKRLGFEHHQPIVVQVLQRVKN